VPAFAGPRRFHRLAVSRVDALCEDAAAVTFDVPPALAEQFRFRAGQSLTIRRQFDGHDERRSYSICAAEGQAARIGVREVRGGAVSGWLVRGVRPGDAIEVGRPTGAFTADLTRPGHHAFIAAGSGITPVLSIAASVLADRHSRATLLYGNRRSTSVMFADELADLKDRYPSRLQLVHVLSREPQEVELFSGRLDAARLRALVPALCPPHDVDHWWLCGPYGMVVDATCVLDELGVPAARVHREVFYVEDVPPDPAQHPEPAPSGTAAEIRVVLDGRTTTVPLERETAILDGAQRARPDLPFACKGGVCGTCRAKVTHGSVRMRRNFALEPNEIDAGYVLTCQAVALSPEVTVDYDA
jgi:ring-1,2-phenylacetyl-CoA epoxidase subunit PaaE